MRSMKNIATITLEDKSQIHIELFPEFAPISVENFISLAESGFYNGLIFHRVIPGFMIQGGGMTPDMEAKAGAKTIKGEFKDNGINNPVTHTLGTVSMARTNVMDSASSQFFICVKDCHFLNGQYAAFGRVLDDESMQRAIEISQVPTHSVGWYENVPVKGVVISKISIHE